MTFDEFIAKWTNQHVDVDGIWPDQCMDLMHQYLMDCFDFSPDVNAAVGAYDVFTEYKWSNLFDRIYNTIDGIPDKGDLIFWDNGVGAWGHVAIFIGEIDLNSFNSFDANWPLGNLPHIQKHNWSNVAGWLHPKQAPVSSNMMEIDKTTFNNLITKLDAQTKTIEQLNLSTSQLNIEIANKTSDIETLKQQVATLNAKNSTLDLQVRDKELLIGELKSQIQGQIIVKPDTIGNQARAIMNGSGFWWTKWFKLKNLLK
jgi:hypothetical protein